MFTVTQEMLETVNEVWFSFLDENNEEVDDCELYLYVMVDGHWTIDHTQYFTNWNDVMTMAPVSFYQSRKELRTELEMNSHDWEMVS